MRRLIGLKDIPSASTVGDWLKRMGEGEGLKRFKHIIDETTRKALHLHNTTEYTLWSDPTLIEADKDAAVKEAIIGIENWMPYNTEEGITTDREIAETVHTMNKTEKAFRLVVLRWKNEQPRLFNPSEY